MSSRDDPQLRALEALSLMRRGESLTAAATEASTAPETVRKYVGRAIERLPNGRYQAKPWDRFERSVRILIPDGPERITVKDSRTASKVGRYWNAVHDFLTTGETEDLERFGSESFQVDGQQFGFIADLDLIERLAFGSEISFEDLYTHTS